VNHQLISWCLRGIQGSPGKAAIKWTLELILCTEDKP
jgi:hypothetical protein